jgi:hypothetical protein
MTFDSNLGKEWKQLAETKILALTDVQELGNGLALVSCLEDDTTKVRLILDVERETILDQVREEACNHVMQVEVIESDQYSRHFIILKQYRGS